MAHDKLNKIAKIHLQASGLGDEHPETDPLNGSDTPSKKKKGPKESASPADVKESPVAAKPKGIK